MNRRSLLKGLFASLTFLTGAAKTRGQRESTVLFEEQAFFEAGFNAIATPVEACFPYGIRYWLDLPRDNRSEYERLEDAFWGTPQ